MKKIIISTSVLLASLLGTSLSFLTFGKEDHSFLRLEVKSNDVIDEINPDKLFFANYIGSQESTLVYDEENGSGSSDIEFQNNNWNGHDSLSSLFIDGEEVSFSYTYYTDDIFRQGSIDSLRSRWYTGENSLNLSGVNTQGSKYEIYSIFLSSGSYDFSEEQYWLAVDNESKNSISHPKYNIKGMFNDLNLQSDTLIEDFITEGDFITQYEYDRMKYVSVYYENIYSFIGESQIVDVPKDSIISISEIYETQKNNYKINYWDNSVDFSFRTKLNEINIISNDGLFSDSLTTTEINDIVDSLLTSELGYKVEGSKVFTKEISPEMSNDINVNEGRYYTRISNFSKAEITGDEDVNYEWDNDIERFYKLNENYKHFDFIKNAISYNTNEPQISFGLNANENMNIPNPKSKKIFISYLIIFSSTAIGMAVFIFIKRLK